MDTTEIPANVFVNEEEDTEVDKQDSFTHLEGINIINHNLLL